MSRSLLCRYLGLFRIALNAEQAPAPLKDSAPRNTKANDAMGAFTALCVPMIGGGAVTAPCLDTLMADSAYTAEVLDGSFNVRSNTSSASLTAEPWPVPPPVAGVCLEP